ncbi:MAG: HAD-IC family P-type ATPase, partial [Clostridia bacterium]|nr:HAD-IC family P-type ATPase [Clostridia bacterium]
MKHYLESTESVLKEVNSTENGLSSSEAEKRLAEIGKNKLKEAEKESLFKKFLNSIADPMIIMLLIAAIIQAGVAVLEAVRAGNGFKLVDFADVLVILVVVIINTIMSLVQESKAEAAMEALMQMTAATSRVIRDGEVKVIKSEDITVGDVVVLEAGDAVPADCRIIESHSLKAEEAALTGESVPVSKCVDVLMCVDSNEEVPLGDRKNMLYSGSVVVYGRGKAVVTGVGMDTEMGKIADALSQAEKEQTPLQIKMAELSRFLTKLVIGISVLVFIVGLVETMITEKSFTWAHFGNASLATFISAIALAVAAIPEGLPAVVTIILSIGVTAMSKRQALIRKLTAVE